MCAGIQGLMERSKNDGVQQGMQQGEEKVSRLITKLVSLQRMDDIEEIGRNPKYLNKLYAEFNMA